MFPIFLQMVAEVPQQQSQAIEQAFDWSKILVPLITTVVGGTIMMVISHFREGSKQYSNRIKNLEVQAVTHENRFTQLQLEREALVDKFETRFVATETKLATVDKLTNEVTRLTTEISHQSQAISKLETKLDKLFDKISSKP